MMWWATFSPRALSLTYAAYILIRWFITCQNEGIQEVIIITFALLFHNCRHTIIYNPKAKLVSIELNQHQIFCVNILDIGCVCYPTEAGRSTH